MNNSIITFRVTTKRACEFRPHVLSPPASNLEKQGPQVARDARDRGRTLRSYQTTLKSSLTLVEIREPGVILSLVLFAVVVAALHRAETRLAFRTGLRVADLVASPLAYAELSAVRRLRMVAFPLDYRDTGAASSRALAPRSPFAPAAVNVPRSIDDGYAFLVLTPLQGAT